MAQIYPNKYQPPMLLLPCDFEANKKGSLEGTKSFADFGMCPKAEKNEMTRNGTHVLTMHSSIQYSISMLQNVLHHKKILGKVK